MFSIFQNSFMFKIVAVLCSVVSISQSMEIEEMEGTKAKPQLLIDTRKNNPLEIMSIGDYIEALSPSTVIIKGQNFQLEGWKRIFELLSLKGNIQELTLCNNEGWERRESDVFQLIQSNPNIVKLSIELEGFNSIKKLMWALHNNQKLVTLEISDFFFLNLKDMVILANWLGTNKKLKKLCLIRCDLDDVCAYILAVALLKNKTLTSLHILENGKGVFGFTMGDKGRWVLEKLLEDNKRISLRLTEDFKKQIKTDRPTARL